jgi:hypothetical protein
MLHDGSARRFSASALQLAIFLVTSTGCAASPSAAAPVERLAERTIPCDLEPPPLPECVRQPLRVSGPSCDSRPSYQHRLTLDWPAPRRAELLALLRAETGALVVEQRGCELILKPGCRGQQHYEFQGLDGMQWRQLLTTTEELWSNLPELADSGTGPVIVDEIRRGRFDLGPWATNRPPPSTPWSPRELGLAGDCSGATHVLISVDVGAGRMLASDTAGSVVGPVLVNAGRMPGCRERRHSIAALARADCLEPLQVSLLPLADTAPLSEPCIAPAQWNHIHCVDPIVHRPAPCLDPYEPTCRPWSDPLAFELAPEQLDEQRVQALISAGACASHRGRLDLVFDGPSGRVTEVCGAGPVFRISAQLALELRLPTSRAPEQRLSIECTNPAAAPRSGELADPLAEAPAAQQRHANRDGDPRATSRSFTVAPAEFVDLNVNFETDASIGVAYCGGSETTAWKVIQFAPNGEMLVFDRGRGAAGKLVFTAPAAGHYSVRWINGGTTTVTLDAAVDVGEGATLHSWVQSWVPRDEL